MREKPKVPLRLLQIVLVIVISLSLTPAQTEPKRIGAIDFYGYAGLNLDQIRSALPIHVSDPYRGPAETIETINKAVRSVTGHPPKDVTPVCCDPQGNYLIFVGLPGTSIKEIKFNPTPNGKLQLPPATIELYEETMDALSAAVSKGNANEDISQGYPLAIGDTGLRAKQLAARAYVTQHEKLVRSVLETSSEKQQRIVAAYLLGYARQSSTQIAYLVRASRDENDIVRNNATRALGVLADSSPKLAARIPAGPFIDMLNSGSWSDRNKAGWVLSSLTKSRDPKVLAQLRSEALVSLIEMARWRSSGHAYTARILLGRIAGIEEERLTQLATAGNVEEIVTAVERKPPR